MFSTAEAATVVKVEIINTMDVANSSLFKVFNGRSSWGRQVGIAVITIQVVKWRRNHWVHYMVDCDIEYMVFIQNTPIPGRKPFDILRKHSSNVIQDPSTRFTTNWIVVKEWLNDPAYSYLWTHIVLVNCIGMRFPLLSNDSFTVAWEQHLRVTPSFMSVETSVMKGINVMWKSLHVAHHKPYLPKNSSQRANPALSV